MEKITELIRNDFQVRRQRHPSFSLRAYARFLGVSLTSLSMSMNNQRKLSQRTKIKILSKIGVDPESLIYEGDEKLEFQHLDLEKLNIVSDWYYFAILSLWETKDYVDKPSWISERLGIDLESADNALKTLKKYRFFTKRGQQFMTPDGIQAYAIRKSHIQAMDLARHS